MTDSSSPTPGLGDLLGLFGGANPLGGVTKAFSQFQRGVADFLSAVENFNESMVQMNVIAGRVNRLLDEFEPPIRALMPQITRTLTAADALVDQMTGPIERVAPGLSRLADTLAAPQFHTLPTDVGDMVGLLGDVVRRLQPLGQLAESAGGLFGLRPFAGLRATPAPAPPAKKAPAKKAPAKKVPAKKAPAK